MLLLVFLLASIWGSFLNVCIYRIPRSGLSVFFPYRSFCPNCKETIRFYDNIPLFSYLLLGGKCRYCRQAISTQYFLVELGTALSLVLLFTYYQPLLELSQITTLVRVIILLSLLIPVSLIDFEKYIVPNDLIIVGLIVGFSVNFADSIIKRDFLD